MKTIAQLGDELSLLKADIMAACEPSRAAQCAVERIVEAMAWLGKCRQRPRYAPANPDEATPPEGLPPRRTGDWPKVDNE